MFTKRCILLLISALLLNSCTTQTGVSPAAEPTATHIITYPGITPSFTPPPAPTATQTAIPVPAMASLSDFQKGAVIFPLGFNTGARPEVAWTMQNIFLPLGINWISIHLQQCEIASVKSTEL